MTKLLPLLIIMITMIALPMKGYAAKSKGNPKYASIVMDADTGMILSQRYADKSLHPASLTKMMTLLLTFEALDRGLIEKKDRIRISNHAASMVPSKLGLPAGSSIKVEDAIYALVTKSANDVAAALAEHIGGSERKFAQLMTTRARTIGMSKTTFRNASGLHDKRQVSTARDMAKMGRYILQRYPHYYRYFSTKNFSYKGKNYHNHNGLLKTYKGMDGFKTGYINASGFNLVASAYRDGRRLIGVVFGGRSSKTRNAHMKEILDSGFKKASKVRIASAKIPPKPNSKPLYGVANAAPAQIATQTATRQPLTSGYATLSALETKQRETKQKIVSNSNIQPNYTALTEALESGKFGELSGQGDLDPAVSKRLETGLIAISMHKGDYKENVPVQVEREMIATAKASSKNGLSPVHPKDVIGKWAVQIGAFNNPTATNEALERAKKNLPPSLSHASSMTIPLKTNEGLVYRARLGGFSQSQAKMSCKYLNDCILVAPSSQSVYAQQ